ncbi:MAG: alanine--tRNA ligase [Candidatus Tectomicrobia bacterium]|uniref:Alanine--tRNA ligase n=1 Tax=Tectimicrobiota bacterium TaxID=2528274 RepID=A0A933LPT6_UNCTE|nr:alanine--tRNA ligase [Candidatus Tectomicrobia bacterium]
MFTGSQIRQKFLEYFQSKGHRIAKSSSLVPQKDPTLLFTNAGMVQFKDVFLGLEKRDYTRATTSQKCMRVSGKHNDLETVGRTARHHTFFEMLGNFSFGDYFKKEAIPMAWELVTEVFKLPPSKLWITIYTDDDEAFDIWHNFVGIPGERIVRLGEKSNFWAMGETGPCGPCSEIHIDQGEGIGCGRPECDVECDCDRFLELWNLVFMQYERGAKGEIKPLPKPSIDTGLGLERVAAVLQGVYSNYDCDLLRPIIGKVEELSHKEYKTDQNHDISMRVIADHSRACCFLLADGIMPSNEGRGYVLRRLIRRAARHGRMIGLEEPFLYRTMARVIDIMKDAYPELLSSEEYISKVILMEEERFANTLDQGLKLLNEAIGEVKAKKQTAIPGKILFQLYDTFGFPLDLAQEIAEDNALTVDEAGFRYLMENQRARARSFWKGSGEGEVKSVYRQLLQNNKPTLFTGYHHLVEEDASILALIQSDQLVSSATKGEKIEVILDKTPFYGESGGQVGDSGFIKAEEFLLEITDTNRPLPELIVHQAMVKSGAVQPGKKAYAEVDGERRGSIVLNHSATHLLHATLRQVLGDHVKQSGSLVAPDRLRFDFTHFSSISERELQRIEDLVNQRIRENLPVDTIQKSLDEALAMGAMALFGEKYGEEVRMVKMGAFSKELCGGTHVRATGEIGFLKIVHESSIAAGIRRIEALTGQGALSHVKALENTLKDMREVLKATSGQELAKLQRIMEQVKELEKEFKSLKAKVASGQIETKGLEVQVNGIKVKSMILENLDSKELRHQIDLAKDKMKSGVVVIGTTSEGKVSLVAGVTKDLTGRVHAGEIIKEVATIVEGTGGGRADMAQAGGKNVGKLEEAINLVPEIVKKHLH